MQSTNLVQVHVASTETPENIFGTSVFHISSASWCWTSWWSRACLDSDALTRTKTHTPKKKENKTAAASGFALILTHVSVVVEIVM